MQVVWFKKDLRIVDHHALVAAAQRGSVLPLYIIEPELWRQPDMSNRHYQFLKDCLEDLDKNFLKLGSNLVIKVGDCLSVLGQLHKKYHIEALWSHQETGNGWTYNRDKKVQKWAVSCGIQWHQKVQNGVTRGLKNRDGWAVRWTRFMQETILVEPSKISLTKEASDTMPTAKMLSLDDDPNLILQKGGRCEGLKQINEFLYLRGEGYAREMSSPVTAYSSCSRISPHLSFGTLSIREVFQSCQKRSFEIKNAPLRKRGKWATALRSFSSRLRWHCHFMQKLEDQPSIEFQNLHPIYNGLREKSFNEDYFEAWKEGNTGYPMVDACMRALKATGWLNFRMRAMLMSFSSYHLWLHWRKPALHIANLFVDYEPGIHYSQVQMQSGTTGINSIRIYNPVKQSTDQDPNGLFIKEWIPELRNIPISYLHTPWKYTNTIKDYPAPIVNEQEARKKASARLYALRKSPQHQTKARKIVQRHGSRKPSRKRKVAPIYLAQPIQEEFSL